jgi:hypothetical protein
MDNFNTLLLLEFLSLRRRQFDTHQQILRNEETCIERSYNLLFSHFRGLNRLSNTQTTQTTETNDFANEMTGILSSLRRNVSRRSTPSLSTQTRVNSFTPRNWSASARNRTTNATNTPRRRDPTFHFPTRADATSNFWNVTPRNQTNLRTETFTWFTPPRTSFSNDEPLPPTQAEIEISTCTHKFSDLSSNQIMCPIARTNFEADDDVLKIIYCGHIFKKQHLLTWFQTKQTCPVCRHNITGISNTPSSSDQIPPLPNTT